MMQGIIKSHHHRLQAGSKTFHSNSSLSHPTLINTDLVAAGALSLVLGEGPPVSERRKRRHPGAR